MSTDLDALRGRIEARKTLAEAASGTLPPGRWSAPHLGWDADADAATYDVAVRRPTGDGGGHVAQTFAEELSLFIAANDPASVIRACDADLALLDDLGDYCSDKSCELVGHRAARRVIAILLDRLLDRYPAVEARHGD